MAYQDIIYRHTKGHFYRIVHFGLDEETLEPEVAYRRCDDKGKFLDRGPPFHRLCTVFFDGRFRVYEEADVMPDDSEITNIFADDEKTYVPFEGAKPVAISDEPDDGLDTMTLETLHPTGEVTKTEVKVPKPEVLVLDEKAFLGGKPKTPTERQVEAGWPDGFGDGEL